jgi:hypothetical protein
MFAVILYKDKNSDSEKIKRNIVPKHWIKNYEKNIIKNKTKVIYMNGNQNDPIKAQIQKYFGKYSVFFHSSAFKI